LHEPVSPEQAQEFIKHLSRSREDWQVKQAEHAMRLYNYFQICIANKTKSSGAQQQETWECIVEETRHMLRLKQRSFRTEKTYLYWIGRFAVFCGWKHPENLTPVDLKNILCSIRAEDLIFKIVYDTALNCFTCRSPG